MRLDVYIHDDNHRVILDALNRLLKQGEDMAKTFEEVSADLAATKAAVDELVREVGVLVARGPGLVTQEQLDELDAKVQAIGAAATAADPNPGTPGV